MRVPILIGLGVLAVLASAAAPASAQVTASAGWNHLHIDQDEGDDDFANFPAGWYADLAGRVAPLVSVVGQVTGNYKDVEGAELSVHTFAAGLRVSTPGPVSPFVQALYGVGRSKYSADGFSDSENDGILKLGGGIDLRGGSAVGVRLGADYVRAFSEEEGTNVFRVGIGVTFGR
jgi:hypothetical protein